MKVENIYAAVEDMVETWTGTACNTDWKRQNRTEMYTEATPVIREHSLEAESSTSRFNQPSKTQAERMWLLS